MKITKVKQLKPKRTKSAIGRNNKAKGSQFERDICKRLSKWWTSDARDDIFYRTGGSGGMATSRASKGKSTANSAGDIGYLDGQGAPLLKAFTFELKKGYPSVSLLRLIDSRLTADMAAKSDNLAGWFVQAEAEARLADAFSWVVIHGPPRRPVMIYLPANDYQALMLVSSEPCRGAYAIVRAPGLAGDRAIAATTLDNFLRVVSPASIEKWLAKK
jgi:hypothetical protein